MLISSLRLLVRSLPSWCYPIRLGRLFALGFVKLGGSEWITFRTSNDVEYTLSLLCRTSAAQIWGHGDHDSEVNMFSKAVIPNTTVIDIGANVGLVTVPLATMCVGSRFLSIEPSSANIEVLQKNIDANKLADRVQVIDCALGAETGTMKLLRESQFGSSTGNARITDEISNVEVSENVPVDTLDNVWNQHGKPLVSFVKIDVEGFEYPVLCGATSMVTKCRPIIYGEFHNVLMPKNGHNFLDVLRLYESDDYVVCQFVTDTTLALVHNPTALTGNAFLIPVERLGDIPVVNI
jgi:FkbM family methyltransferase